MDSLRGERRPRREWFHVSWLVMNSKSVVLSIAIFAAAMLFCATSVWALTVEQEAKLLPSDGAPGDLFGAAFAVNGNPVVVTIPRQSPGGLPRYSALTWLRRRLPST